MQIKLGRPSDSTTPRKSPSGGDVVLSSAQILLRRVFRILRGCGIRESELRLMANAAITDVVQIPDPQPSRVTARQAMMCCDVVLRWRRDCRFVDDSGLPSRLSIHGPQNSFESLVRDSAPEASANTMLETMIELGVARLTDNNRVELVSESVVTCSGQEGAPIASECVLEHICGFLGSVEFNVFEKPSRANGRFERACYASVPRELVPILQQLVNSRGQAFVDVIDEWLSRRSTKPTENNDTVLVGAGAYVFIRDHFA
jgi:hypothetical protein